MTRARSWSSSIAVRQATAGSATSRRADVGINIVRGPGQRRHRRVPQGSGGLGLYLSTILASTADVPACPFCYSGTTRATVGHWTADTAPPGSQAAGSVRGRPVIQKSSALMMRAAVHPALDGAQRVLPHQQGPRHRERHLPLRRLELNEMSPEPGGSTRSSAGL
jgi:hypothetical protein